MLYLQFWRKIKQIQELYSSGSLCNPLKWFRKAIMRTWRKCNNKHSLYTNNKQIFLQIELKSDYDLEIQCFHCRFSAIFHWIFIWLNLIPNIICATVGEIQQSSFLCQGFAVPLVFFGIHLILSFDLTISWSFLKENLKQTIDSAKNASLKNEQISVNNFRRMNWFN